MRSRPVAVAVTTSLRGNRCSARQNSRGNTSGASCISPCIGNPLVGDGSAPAENTLPGVDERRRRRRLAALLAPISCLVVASMVGSALAPTLVSEHPVWLLCLDARIRHVLLVANRVD